MAEGRERREWGRTSSLMALIAEVNRVKGQPFKPADFNPMAEQPKPIHDSKFAFEALKATFGPSKARRKRGKR